MENQEIEFGVKVSNTQELLEFLKSNSRFIGTTKTTKKIYKKAGTEFFFKVSQEEKDDVVSYKFSLKEDLLSKGVSDGMKVSKEVDVDLSNEQLGKIESIISILGYDIDNEFKCTRHSFEFENCMVTVDEYDTNGYLEIEGTSEEIVNAVVAKIPFKKLEK